MPTVSSLIVLLVWITVALVAVDVIRRILTGGPASRWPLMPPIVRRCTAPAFALAFTAGTYAGLPSRRVLDRAWPDVRHLLSLALIASVTWLLLRAAYAGTDVAVERLTAVEGERNVRARRIRTQVLVLRRMSAAIIVIIAVASMLVTFPVVRAFGTGLFASAGVAGIVVDGEWGRVEELTLTYVVLRLWDERRLVLPVSYFTHSTFENWTRHSSRVIGSVLLHVDWNVPVEELRTELYALLREHPLWDQKDWVLQVTDVLPSGLIQVRALMSAHDAPSAFDLRCDVREHLIRFIREKHPSALPRLRADLAEAVWPTA